MNNSTLFEKTPVALSGQVSEFKNNVPFLGSMNYGRVYPVYKKLVMPGDRLYLDATSVIRGADPIAPVMGDTQMEYHAFFVPLRIIWNHFKQFLGENDTSAWTQNNEYLMPKVSLGVGGLIDDATGTDPWTVYQEGDTRFRLDLKTSAVFGANRLADYLGIHPSLKSIIVRNLSFRQYFENGYSGGQLMVNALPFRAYWEIWNHAYRNENYMDPVLFSKDDNLQKLPATTRDEDAGSVYNPFGNYIPYRYEFVSTDDDQDGEGSAFVLPASKLKDAFTTVLPEAQKGPQVDLLSIGGKAPVVSSFEKHSGVDANNAAAVHTKIFSSVAPTPGTVQTLAKAPIMGANADLSFANNGASANLQTSGYGVAFDNLYADLTNTANLTINAFRLAATTQQWYELAARAGTRFDETIFANFGVFAPSSQIDVPEYLGGVKFAINSWQVPQTAPNADGSGLGTVGAFTHTSDTGSSLVGKAFTEWGYVMIMAVPRVHHEYATFCDPHFFQEGKFDLYWPLFDHIGEQPIPEKVMNPAMALFNTDDNEPWSETLPNAFKPDSSIGFQEAWWFERYSFGNVAGVLNPVNPNSLDYWTYVEELESPLNMGPLFMSAYDDAAIVDKTLQLGAEASLHGQQLMVSIMFEERCSRRMSLRSVPGITRI